MATEEAEGLAIEALRREGWRCALIRGPGCPFPLIAARKGEVMLVALCGPAPAETGVAERLPWAQEFNAHAEEWHLTPDRTFVRRVLHRPTSDVHREVRGVIDSAGMRGLEEVAASHGLSRLLMMENAGRSVASLVNRYVGGVGGKRVVIVAGLGNNGGDGMAAGRHLSILGGDVRVILLGRSGDIRTEEARINWNILAHMPSVKLEYVSPEGLSEAQRESILNAHIVLDAILGTGLRGEVREPQRSAILAINESRGLVFAVDVPSGLDPDTGAVAGVAVRAHATITLHMAKPGLLKRPDLVGELWVGSIGIPHHLS